MSEPLSVALLRDPCEVPGASMQLYADGLAAALANLGVRPVSGPPRAAFPSTPGRLRKAGRYLARYWRAPRQVRAVRADLYHIMDHANAHWLRALPAERTLVTCHDLILLKLASGSIRWRGAPPRLASRALRFSVSHLARAATVICDSECTRMDALLLLGCPAERLRVVRPGVHEAFRPQRGAGACLALARRLALDGRVTLLHVGHSLPYKNLEGLIQALASLPRPWAERVQLVKAGSDLTPAQWRLVKRYGLAQRVKAIGRLSLPELALLYNVADLLVFPSLYEGFGWPPLEAMASGTPVVCSDRGALAELATDAACRVDPEDPADIARGIVRTLEDEPYRQRLVQAGLAHVGSLTWERAAREISAIYDDVRARA